MKLLSKIKSLLSYPQISHQQLIRQEMILLEQLRLNDIQYRDMLDMFSGKKNIYYNKDVRLETNHPVAYQSQDHINPLGTIQDNTRNIAFYNKCKSIYGHEMSFLDLGCSGGGIVFEFALNGHLSIGLEGSDHSKNMGRANWRTIPTNLYTCDITKPFQIVKNDTSCIHKFDVISCWEVLEHIPEENLMQIFTNITNHLDNNGIFIGSISRNPHDPLHITIENEVWWEKQFNQYGFQLLLGYNNGFEFYEFCRGIKGGLFDTSDYKNFPESGFHFIARKL